MAREKVLGVGINLSGRINNASGYSDSYFYFHEEPLAQTIEQHVGIKTFLENDSRAMAYDEACCGAVSNERNVLYVKLDYGIGVGILIDGKVYYGKSGFSGELGHIPFFNNKIICHCGKKGCLETEASGSTLLLTLKEKINAGSSTQLLQQIPTWKKSSWKTWYRLRKMTMCWRLNYLRKWAKKLAKGWRCSSISSIPNW